MLPCLIWVFYQEKEKFLQVFQRRKDGSAVSFVRNWSEYKAGFGDPGSTDFWLGNDHLHHIASTGEYELRVDIEWFTEERVIFYQRFAITDESDNYRLSIFGCSAPESECMTLRFFIFWFKSSLWLFGPFFFLLILSILHKSVFYNRKKYFPTQLMVWPFMTEWCSPPTIETMISWTACIVLHHTAGEAGGSASVPHPVSMVVTSHQVRPVWPGRAYIGTVFPVMIPPTGEGTRWRKLRCKWDQWYSPAKLFFEFS